MHDVYSTQTISLLIFINPTPNPLMAPKSIYTDCVMTVRVWGGFNIIFFNLRHAPSLSRLFDAGKLRLCYLTVI